MMDTNKIQKDFLSKLLNYKEKNSIAYCFRDNDIGLTDGITLYFIPKRLCLLNMENAEKSEPFSAKRLLECEQTVVEAERSPELLPGEGKSLLVHFFSGNIHVYVNQKAIKYFSENAKYFISSEKNLVFIRENEKLVGIVIPVNRKR